MAKLEGSLHDQLYPFIEEHQRCGEIYWLAEDNTGNHTKAARMDKYIRGREAGNKAVQLGRKLSGLSRLGGI